MTATLEQPRDDAGRFASYRRPPVPASRPRHQRVTAPVEPSLDGWEDHTADDGTAYRVRRLMDSVPLSVVSVCCPGCVYGVQA